MDLMLNVAMVDNWMKNDLYYQKSNQCLNQVVVKYVSEHKQDLQDRESVLILVTGWIERCVETLNLESYSWKLWLTVVIIFVELTSNWKQNYQYYNMFVLWILWNLTNKNSVYVVKINAHIFLRQKDCNQYKSNIKA